MAGAYAGEHVSGEDALLPIDDQMHQRWVRVPVVSYLNAGVNWSKIVAGAYPALVPPEEVSVLQALVDQWPGFEMRVRPAHPEELWYESGRFKRYHSTHRGHCETFEEDYVCAYVIITDVPLALRTLELRDDPPLQLLHLNVNGDPQYEAAAALYWQKVRDYDFRRWFPDRLKLVGLSDLSA